MVEAGLEPHEAFKRLPGTQARFLGRANELGTIATGKLADLVLLDANPLENISNTQRIRAVVMNGRLLDRAVLDEMLAQGAKTEEPASRFDDPSLKESVRPTTIYRQIVIDWR